MVIGSGIEALGDLDVTDLGSAPRGRTTSLRRAGDDIIWEISFETAAPLPTPLEEAKAVYFISPGRVELRNEPVEPGPGEVLVKSRIIGISHGTEMQIYQGTFPPGSSDDALASLDGPMEYPLKYGYMNAGQVDDGDRVFAFYPHQDRFCCPSDRLIRFPDDIGFEDIVLYPSMETAYTLVLDTACLPGERVLVIGQGMIGLLTASMLNLQTGLHTAAIETDEYRSGRSAEAGIRCVCTGGLNTGEIRKIILTLFGGKPPYRIIHLSGTGFGLQLAIDSAAFEGRITEGSWYGSRTDELRLGENFHRKRLTLAASQVSSVPGNLVSILYRPFSGT